MADFIKAYICMFDKLYFVWGTPIASHFVCHEGVYFILSPMHFQPTSAARQAT